MSNMVIYWWPGAKKLICLKEKATSDFWDRQWQTEDWKKRITRSRNSRYWFSILKKYLPDKKARVLEGGCGDGHIVDAMNYWGYQSVGVDFAQKTVAKIKEVAPELNVNYGDVRTLNYEDGSFDGYWLLGVIEHFWEGYDDILREMKRVLKVGGYAFVTFPCISRLDRLKIFFSGYKEFTGFDMPDNFYQFVLDANITRRDFERAGFRCLRSRRRNGWYGLTRLWPAVGPVRCALFRLSEKSWCMKLLVLGIGVLIAPLCGHGVLLVLQKH